MVERYCSDKWSICIPTPTLRECIIIAIIILSIFIILGWFIWKDRRDNNGRDNKGR